MSVIVALKEKTRIYVGSDTYATNDDGQIWPYKEKIWKSSMNENILMAGTGEMRVTEHVHHAFPFIPDVPDFKNVYEWLCPILDRFKENKYWSFLICGNAKIFLARYDCLIIEAKEYESIGSGRDLANGSLFSTKNVIHNPEERIRIAISAAMTYDTGVGGNIKIEMI